MKAESGNALWFILLAIALLAALTITITRGSDTSEQSGDVERQRVLASDTLRYAKSVEQAVEQMRQRGTSESDISFENGFVGGYANGNCGSNDCKVFHVEGGGIAFRSANSLVSGDSWLFTGANSVAGAGEDGTGATSSFDNELIMMLPDISAAVCGRINTELGIAGIPQDTTKADVATKFAGVFPNGQVIENMGGEKTGCFEGNQDDGGASIAGKYYFYHTLIQR